MMKFALLGDDPIVLPLIREIAARADCGLTHIARLGQQEIKILHIAPSARIVNGWEELLGKEIDVVILCGSAESIGESAKQLAAAGRPLVVFPQGAWNTELIYELSLIRDDNGVRLIPACPQWVHPLFSDSPPATPADAADDPDRILHLRLEREVRLAEGSQLSEASLRTHLLADVGLLRKLGGEYHRVTAVKSHTPTGEIMMATVTLTGDNLPDAMWTIRPATGKSRWLLTISRPSGTQTYQSLGEEGTISQQEDGLENESNTPANPGTAVLEHIERSLLETGARPDWTDLTRDFEVLDAVARSFTRRRTIDLHFETTSERSQFKTQMTAIGCSVLMLTMFAVIALLILGSVLDARGPVEIAADKANTIFYEEEFVPNESELTPAGQTHWEEVEDARHDPAIVPILVEQGKSEILSTERQEHLVELLENEGVPNAKQRVEVYALDGPWFETVMRVGRIVVFLPLFLFLGLQFLLFLARPSQTDRNFEKNQ